MNKTVRLLQSEIRSDLEDIAEAYERLNQFADNGTLGRHAGGGRGGIVRQAKALYETLLREKGY